MSLGNFILPELVPELLYKLRGDKAIQLLDKEAVEGLVKLREDVGKPFIVNTWYYGGNRDWSGLRTPDSPYYSMTSQHSFGRAFDIISTKFSANYLQQYVLDNHDKYGITGLELRSTWTHVDWRYSDKLVTFNA